MFDSLILIIGLLLMFLAALGGWISERVYRNSVLKEIKKQIKSNKHWLEERIKHDKKKDDIKYESGMIRAYYEALEIIKEVLK